MTDTVSRSAAEGEPFDVFYRREYGSMVALARALTPDGAAAEDLAQESFLAAHRNWERVKGYDDPRAWLRRVLINRATSLRRRLMSELRAVDRLGRITDHVVDRELTTDGQQIWREVRRLPRRQAQAIALHYVAQLTVAEAAEVMGCSRGAVKAHLHRGRERLAGRLESWKEMT